MCTLVEHDCVSRLFTASPFVSPLVSFFFFGKISILLLLVILLFSLYSTDRSILKKKLRHRTIVLYYNTLDRMIPLSAKIKLSHEFTILKSSTFQRYLLFRNFTTIRNLLFIAQARVKFVK